MGEIQGDAARHAVDEIHMTIASQRQSETQWNSESQLLRETQRSTAFLGRQGRPIFVVLMASICYT